MTVRELLASAGDLDEGAEVFVVTSSDGTHIDGRVELAYLEELTLPDGRTTLACVPRVPRYAVSGHGGRQPLLQLAHSDDTKPAA